MKPVLFTGAGVAIITPFNEDQSVNYDRFAQLVEDQVKNGTDAIVVCISTSSSSALKSQTTVCPSLRAQAATTPTMR